MANLKVMVERKCSLQNATLEPFTTVKGKAVQTCALVKDTFEARKHIQTGRLAMAKKEVAVNLDLANGDDKSNRKG